MARMNSDAALPLVGVLVFGAALVGLVIYGRSARAASPSPLPGLKLEPIGLLPGLKFGDAVVVDTAAANIPPERANGLPTLICNVDGLLSDPLLVSVRAVGASFAGTIVRSAIVRVLTPAGGFEL